MQNEERTISLRTGWVHMVLVLAMVLVFVSSLALRAGAQTPESEAVADPTQPVVTEPTPVPTQIPATEPAATETLTPDVPAEPTAEPTADPTIEPTVAPTAIPMPVVTWSQPEQVTCTLRDGAAPGLAFNESRTYRCSADIVVESDAMPTDMTIEWALAVTFADSAEVTLPIDSKATILRQEPGETASTRVYTIAQPWVLGAPSQKIKVDIVLTRTTCAVGEQVLSVSATPTIGTERSAADIRFTGEAPKPARLVSPVISPAGPSVGFDGPIVFESVNATSAGLESNRSRGTATLVVTGEWDPCQSWTLSLSGSVDVPAETPAQLRVVSINSQQLSGGACDLQTVCDIGALPDAGTAATPLRYTLGLELQLHELTPVGDFGIRLQSDVQGVGNQP